MKQTQNKWYSISKIDKASIACAICQNEIQLTYFLDHDMGLCKFCGIECAFLDWKGRKIQIVPKFAPDAVYQFISWMQKELDELEYVELFSSFEEINEDLED